MGEKKKKSNFSANYFLLIWQISTFTVEVLLL
jgi:hypothetical protein